MRESLRDDPSNEITQEWAGFFPWSPPSTPMPTWTWQALQSLAYEETVRFGEMALRAFEESTCSDEDLKCQLELAKALGQAGRFGCSCDFFRSAAERAGRIDSGEKLAEAALGLEKWS